MSEVAISRRVGRAFFGHLSGLREAQRDAAPHLLAGQDVLVVAGTGSGKTEAVLVPFVDRYLAGEEAPGAPALIYVAPTKALVNDLVGRLERPMHELGLSVGARHGERDDLSRADKPHLLITTLESYDSVLSGKPRLFDGVRGVVIDEVHQLAGTQRGLQLKHVLSRHEHRLGRHLHVAAMSATVGDPLAMWQRIRPSPPAEVVIAAEARTRRYVMARAETEERLRALLDKAAPAKKVICFAGSRRRTEQVAALAQGGAFADRVLVHHSSLSAATRLLVEEEFRRPEPALVVATSTLELGIDIGDVGLVVLIGAPTDWRSFAQRIGRANRRGTEVKVLCIVPPDAGRPVREVAAFLALARQVEQAERPGDGAGLLIGATTQQLVNQLRQAGADTWQSRSELAAALGIADAEAVEELLEAVRDEDLVLQHPVHRSQWAAGPGVGELQGTGDLWGNFPISSSTITLLHHTRVLGEVPGTNRASLAPGARFTFQGRTWEVTHRSRGRLAVLPSLQRATVQLKFGRKGVPLDVSVVSALPRAVTSSSPASVGMDPMTQEWWDQVREHLAPVLVGADVVTWLTARGRCVTATWAGAVLNAAVLELLEVDGTSDDTCIRTAAALDLQALPADVASWEKAIAAVVEVPGELTTWQQRLPPAWLKRELVEAVTTSPLTAQLIHRLRTAEVCTVDDDRLEALSAEPDAPPPSSRTAQYSWSPGSGTRSSSGNQIPLT